MRERAIVSLNKENSKLSRESVKIGMTTYPIVVGVRRMKILSWIQSEDWNITVGVMREIF